MDFKDYINELRDLDNQEARTELDNIYILNSSTIKFFKFVDKTLQNLLSQSEISISVVKEIKLILTQLNELKRDINSLDAKLLSDNKIKQNIDYIKNQMSLSEVEDVSQDFSKLCNERKNLLIKHESERKRKEQERFNKKKFELQERERKKKELEAAEQQRQEQINWRLVFEHTKSDPIFGASVGAIAIFVDGNHFVNIEQGQAHQGYFLKGAHRIKFSYTVNRGFLLFESYSDRIIEFDISLQGNMRIYLRAKGGWSENKLEYNCSYE